MKGMTGSHYFRNGEMIRNDGSINAADNKDIIYEVIRIIHGKPLFFEDHFKRFHQSAVMSGFNEIPSEEEVFGIIMELVHINNMEGVNVRIEYSPADKGAKGYNLEIGLLKTARPEDEEIQKGVKLKTYLAERLNPHVKSAAESYKDILSGEGYRDIFEILLVDSNGYITEGSKSNVFFIKSGRVITSEGKKVLEGITRMHVLKLCREIGIEVVEKEIRLEELEKMDALFITATSVDILPVRCVDDREFDVEHPIMKKLLEAYLDMADNYIEKFRSDK
ncbi:MAG: hypothetical protein HGA49_07295 [Eubacteriaceae bacterium]|nr:hypothetical protein [Eubacteriaceae bacterium]